MICPLTGQDLTGTSPLSGWTKNRIIRAAKLNGATDKVLDWLSGMTTETIQAIMLVPIGYCICGSSRYPNMRQKVMYYRLDIDLIKYMGAVL